MHSAARYCDTAEPPHRLADRIAQTGLSLECRVDLQEPIVHGVLLLVEQDIDDAEPLADGMEERPQSGAISM